MDALNINNVNISEIIQDAFLNKPNLEQVITGSKRFLKLEAEDVVCLQNLNVSEVNGLNISEIDKKIISKNSLLDVPIEGKKVFFGGLQAKKIEVCLFIIFIFNSFFFALQILRCNHFSNSFPSSW